MDVCLVFGSKHNTEVGIMPTDCVYTYTPGFSYFLKQIIPILKRRGSGKVTAFLRFWFGVCFV